jgi:hypothetical protein
MACGFRGICGFLIAEQPIRIVRRALAHDAPRAHAARRDSRASARHLAPPADDEVFEWLCVAAVVFRSPFPIFRVEGNNKGQEVERADRNQLKGGSERGKPAIQRGKECRQGEQAPEESEEARSYQAAKRHCERCSHPAGHCPDLSEDPLLLHRGIGRGGWAARQRRKAPRLTPTHSPAAECL